MKWGTHAQVFSQTLAHGTERMTQDKETEYEGKKRGVSMEKKVKHARTKFRRIITT